MSYDLKSETEVKQYIDNLGTEYRFGCYSEKNPEVCHLLGDYLEGIKKDHEKASKVYRSNCDDYSYGRSCLKYGNYSILGKGSTSEKGDPVKAYKYYEKGCDLKESDCCLHSGLLLVSKSMPKEIKRDVPKAFELLSKSCELNNGSACFYLSGMYISGVLKDDVDAAPTMTKPHATPTDSSKLEYLIEKNMKKAFEFTSKACGLRNVFACANLSQMYTRGEGTEKDEKKAEMFKSMALDIQNEMRKTQAAVEFQQGLPQT